MIKISIEIHMIIIFHNLNDEKKIVKIKMHKILYK